jgi:hypothetical protein
MRSVHSGTVRPRRDPAATSPIDRGKHERLQHSLGFSGPDHRRAAKGTSSGSIDEADHLTTDQRLKVAEVAALLSTAQELSAIRHEGINPEFSTH